MKDDVRKELNAMQQQLNEYAIRLNDLQQDASRRFRALSAQQPERLVAFAESASLEGAASAVIESADHLLDAIQAQDRYGKQDE